MDRKVDLSLSNTPITKSTSILTSKSTNSDKVLSKNSSLKSSSSMVKSMSSTKSGPKITFDLEPSSTSNSKSSEIEISKINPTKKISNTLASKKQTSAINLKNNSHDYIKKNTTVLGMIRSNIIGIVLVIMLFILSLLVFIFTLTYLPKLDKHTLGCGYYVIEKYNNVFKKVNEIDKTNVLINNGITSYIYSDKETTQTQKKYATEAYEEYRKNKEFFSKNCEKIKHECKNIHTLNLEVNSDYENYAPNEKTLYSWMSAHGSFAYKSTFILTFASFIITIVYIIGLVIKFIFLPKCNSIQRILFMFFNGIVIIITISKLICTILLYTTFDALKDGLILGTFIMTAIIISLLGSIIILIQLKKI
ncbi:Hypothetical protein SRAE_2000046100 [Strongyloides ratti]|uniref:Uncharacterized protein n=1 Tax=Strongyloides ratti TaxID=34506 RepID=A0A090LE69_STRRB|nr:Hypothetical protein SRAE_2000046100 [Strongyloides ratti]CEF65785.1 Hypothetical protein SRAE_2000046100 [Strongyloides ratti]